MTTYPALMTQRLRLEPLAVCDAEQVRPLFAQWDVVRYLNARVPWPFPADGVRSYYESVALPAVERGEEWHWTIRLLTEPARIMGSISLVKDGLTNRGFWIDPKHQGHGYATEAADAVTAYWFDGLKMPRMRITKAAEHGASRRVTEKQGFRVVERTESEYVCGRLPTEIWEMTAEDWTKLHPRA